MKRTFDGLVSLLAKSLHSRKFWAAVAASAPFAAVQDWTNFSYVWCGYVGVLGAVDAAEGHGAKKAVVSLGASQEASPAPSEVDTPTVEGAK